MSDVWTAASVLVQLNTAITDCSSTRTDQAVNSPDPPFQHSSV
jgi:hypothetical protein